MGSSRLLAVALLAGCGNPTTTTAAFMVGELVDHGDLPVKGVRVQSVEHGHVTGPDGRFGIAIKEPDQYASWQMGNTWFRRTWLPSDQGTVVRVKLPELRSAELLCEADCELRLHWELGDALAATLTHNCKAGSGSSLLQLPVSPPTATCGFGPSTTPVQVRDDGARVTLLAPPQPVTLELRGGDEPLPEDCAVWVDGEPAAPGEAPHSWTAKARPSSHAYAVCAGRPSAPALIGSTKELSWSSSGPSLVLDAAPEVGKLVLLRRGADGWSLPLVADEQGGFSLPPLPAGDYLLFTGEEPPLVLPPVSTAPSGRLVLPPAEGTAPRVGTLHLDHDLDEGTIRTDG